MIFAMTTVMTTVTATAFVSADSPSAGPLPRRQALGRLARCAALGVALPVLGLTGCDRSGSAGGGSAPAFRGLDVTGVGYGRDFRLPDVDGQVRTLQDFRGKAVLVFFGFVLCPDICPTALARAVEVKELLGEQAGQLQVIFITVDPERDTPELLREYMAAFDPGFIALRGDAGQLRATASEFKVYYKQVPTSSSYTMDHSAQTYAFDTEGRLRVVLNHTQPVEDYVHDIRLLLQPGPQSAGHQQG